MPEAPQIRVYFDKRHFVRAMDALPGKVAGHVFTALRDAGKTFERDFSKNRLKGGARGGFGHMGAGLNMRTGRLTGSLFSGVSAGVGLKPRLEVGIGGGAAPYAGIHETGGTIRPKRARWLTIPVADGLTRAGVPRYKSPRDVPDGFFHRKGANLFFMQRTGPRSAPQLLFALVKSARIPPRLEFEKSFRKAEPDMRARIERGIQDAVKEVDRG